MSDTMVAMTRIASPLAQALTEPSFAREAVIEAIMVAVDSSLNNGVREDEDIVTELSMIFTRLGLTTHVHGSYGLANELWESRKVISALEAGADPRWFVDEAYKGDTEQLRTELIDNARRDWRYSIDHINVA